MKKNKIRTIAIRGGHAVMAVGILAIICLVSFSIKIHKTFTNLVTADIGSNIKYCAEAFSRTLEINADTTNFACEQAASGEATEEDILKSLKAIKQVTDSYQVMYVTADKKAVDYENVQYDMSSVEYAYIFETEERSYFYTENDGLRGTEAFIICNPAMDANGKVKAYIIEFLPITVISNDLSGIISYSYSFYAVMDSNNEVVTIVGRDKSSEFLRDDIAQRMDVAMDNDSLSWNVLTKNYISKGIQKVEHATVGSEGRYLINAPIKAANWNIVAFVRDAYVDYEVDKFNKPVESLIIEFSCCFGLLVIVYIVIMTFIFLQTKETKKELEGKAETDLLTGLNNKLTTELKIADYIRENPNGQGVLLLIDVDNFKKVNDKMGHAFGDEVLRTLGVKLKSLFRSTDIIGRIGGDEFVVFLRDVNDVAIIVREARKLENFFKDFQVGEYVKYSVTASLGASIYSMDGYSFEELYKNADSALYDAKHKGKKQLAFYKAEEKDFLK